MAKKEELEISISETGEITLNVIGAKGKKCMELTKELEEALGMLKSVEMKSEYYQQEETQGESVNIKGGDNN